MHEHGVAVILLYLAEGIIGLPVFASGAGLAYLMGPTAGYLLGFVLAAGIVGYAADRGWTRSLVKGVAVMTLATATIYLLGVAWLATSVMGGDWLKAVQVGAIPPARRCFENRHRGLARQWLSPCRLTRQRVATGSRATATSAKRVVSEADSTP